MQEDFEMDRERIHQMRRMARKLAHNKSRDRVVRRLPQSVVIVMTPRQKRAVPMRRAINGNKRLTYIMLLGATLCAFMYDVDPQTLTEVLQTVNHAAQAHLGGLLGST